MNDRVRFLGWRGDVETIYAAADAIVLTSDNEGMPVSLIEAAAAARPAVTTDVGSAGEVVADGRTGFVVPPATEPIADALLRLIADPALARRMGDAARERARELFSEDRLVADVAAIYDELPADRRKR